jgi:hypothetical protein
LFESSSLPVSSVTVYSIRTIDPSSMAGPAGALEV